MILARTDCSAGQNHIVGIIIVFYPKIQDLCSEAGRFRLTGLRECGIKALCYKW